MGPTICVHEDQLHQSRPSREGAGPYPQEYQQPMPQMSPAESEQARPAPKADQGGQEVPHPPRPDGG
eukprot:12936670-Prorocentrum_lima.AAC.1